MLIDTHCHLTDEGLASQMDEVLSRAKEVGVTKIIAPSTSLEDAKEVLEIADKYDEVFGLVGIHPENISEKRFLDYARNDKDLVDELSRLVKSSKKVVGIGEIGLDFHYDVEKKSKDRQIAIFQEQLELAVELDLPVAIHMRDAEVEMGRVLEQMEKLPSGQFHCWAGKEGFLKMVLNKGFYVSFCGNITFKSADNLRELIKIVPPGRLLLETDSPYLSPEPRRGSLNEPANVTILAEYIANLLDLPIETLINQTTANAKCLYFGG
ncbi:TatD family hydrolase [Candidatus Collierbacteria bacterium]|nr:TatD family hydrolase [Candidatus Collierbacteria bacterium]